jgi:hypothetical protein
VKALVLERDCCISDDACGSSPREFGKAFHQNDYVPSANHRQVSHEVFVSRLWNKSMDQNQDFPSEVPQKIQPGKLAVAVVTQYKAAVM